MKSCWSAGPSACFLTMANVPHLITVSSVTHAAVGNTRLIGVLNMLPSDYDRTESSHKTSPHRMCKVLSV